MKEYWYRYEEVHYAPPLDEWESPCGWGHTEVYRRRYGVVKTTPKGVRLDNGRFVLRDARKRWACPTDTAARESFLARKNAHKRILQSQINKVDRAIAKLPNAIICDTPSVVQLF